MIRVILIFLKNRLREVGIFLLASLGAVMGTCFIVGVCSAIGILIFHNIFNDLILCSMLGVILAFAICCIVVAIILVPDWVLFNWEQAKEEVKRKIERSK